MIRVIHPSVAMLLIGPFVTPCSLVAENQPATEMVYPYAVAVGEDGTIFVVDRNLPGVWKISDGKLAIFHQAKKQLRTPLNVPRCAAIDSQGRLLVGCSPTREVYRLDEDGKPTGLTGGGSGGIGIPMGIGVAKNGDIFVSDLEQHCVWKIGKDGGKPKRLAKIPAPRGVFVDDKDNLWVVSTERNSLYRVAPDGKTKAVLEGRAFRFPSNVVVDKDGTAYVCDSYSKAIWKVSPEGEPEKLIEGKPFEFPVGLALMKGDLIVADPKAKTIFRVTTSGKAEAIAAKPATN